MGLKPSPVRDLLESAGARFGELAAAETALGYAPLVDEYTTVREAVSLSDFSFTARYKVPEEGLELLDRYAAGPVANIRFGRVLHTFAADPDGMLESDLFIANDDEHMYVICENLLPREAQKATLDELNEEKAPIEDISESTALFSLDGYNAWAVAKDLFGADVLGLPYLSIETYELDEVELKLIRAGKTSEFGYLILVPGEHAHSVWNKIVDAGAPHGLKPVGLDAHHLLRLDGRFFNIHREGAAVKDPLALGLQWMIDLDGEDFRGRAALMARREQGLTKKIVGLVASDPTTTLAENATVHHDGVEVAHIVTAGHSPTLGRHIALALFDVAYAYAGLVFHGPNGEQLETLSMPPFLPKSLTVKLDEM